jgi:hypothetical protein
VTTISIARDDILHMGLPWHVAVDGRVLARFAEKVRAVHFAHELHDEFGGWRRNIELIIQPRTPTQTAGD